MPILRADDGAVELENGLCFLPRMRRDALEGMLHAVLGSLPPRMESPEEEPPQGEFLLLPPCEACGGVLAPVCQLSDDRLEAVWFWVQRADQEQPRDHARQRAFLFRCLGREDPSPADGRAVVFDGPRARAMIATDPRVGDAVMRISFR